MKTLILFIVSFLITISSYGQYDITDSVVYDIPILRTAEINIGFYKSWSEFLNNNPKYPFTAEFRNPNGNLYYVTYKQKKSAIVLHNDTLAADAQGFLYQMWGYYDGKYLYLNVSSNIQVVYARAEKLQRFTPVTINIPQSHSGLGGAGAVLKGAGMAGAGVAAGLLQVILISSHNPSFALDILNNQLIPLNEKGMRYILEVSPELLQKFDKLKELQSSNANTANQVFLMELNKAYLQEMMTLYSSQSDEELDVD